MKYHSIRSWSNLCNRWFDSKAECRRGEELCLLEKAGEIKDLEYQKSFTLSTDPKVVITIDFAYKLRLDSDPILEKAGKDRDKILLFGETIYEDVKGVLTRDFRTKMAWLKKEKGIEVKLTEG